RFDARRKSGESAREARGSSTGVKAEQWVRAGVRARTAREARASYRSWSRSRSERVQVGHGYGSRTTRCVRTRRREPRAKRAQVTDPGPARGASGFRSGTGMEVERPVPADARARTAREARASDRSWSRS